MGLNVGNLPVTGVYVGTTPVQEVYVGSSLVWSAREKVQITLDTFSQAQRQFRAALTDRGLDYRTVTEIPFDIELVGTGSATHMFDGCAALTHVRDMDTSNVTDMSNMFYGCSSLTHAPAMDTRNVTSMFYMFYYCTSLTHVPDMDTSQVTNMSYMFRNCSALTDGNVRLFGRHPRLTTTNMIRGSGLTFEPFYTDIKGPGVHEVSLTGVLGQGTVHPLLAVGVPAGETWNVRIQGTVTGADGNVNWQPYFRIGTTDSGRYGPGAAVDFSGTVTAANSAVMMVTNSIGEASFTGTVTIEK